MYCKIRVGPFELVGKFPLKTLSRAESVPEGGKFSDISSHKESRSVGVEEVTSEVSGSKCEGVKHNLLHLRSLFIGRLSA